MVEQPTHEGVIAVIAKFFCQHFSAASAAVLGAAIMAACKPPENRRELFSRAFVAFGCSMLFGGVFLRWLDSYFTWIDLAHATAESHLEIVAAAHGIIGAVSWAVVSWLSSTSIGKLIGKE